MQANSPIELDDATANRFEIAKRWRLQARIAQADNRAEMATDENFYDAIQLEPEDIAIMMGRDQPPLTFNITKNVTNFILGIEQQAKIDWRVLPRRADQSGNAKTKTKALKFVDDISMGAAARSFAFSEAAIAGVGWLESGARNSSDEPLFIRAERWRNMWFDHLSTALDYTDMRYVWREKWTDLDVAIALFPQHEEALSQICDANNSLYPWRGEDAPIIDVASEFDMEDGLGYYGANGDVRERVKLIEMEYRVPAKVKLMKARGNDTPFGSLNGAIYREDQEDHKYLVEGKYFTLSDALKMTVRRMIWTANLHLQDKMTPYNHNSFSFTPIFCYRFKGNNMPYGVIRDFRDPQTDLNRRKSKLLFLLSANQYIIEEKATNNPAKFHEEMQRPDGMGMVKEGKINMVKNVDHSAQIKEHSEVAKDDERFIHTISGVTPSADWQEKKELSGKAITNLENQSKTTHGVLFANYWHGLQLTGEKMLSNLEQFWDSEKEFRITGDQQKDEFAKVNKRKEDGTIEDSIIADKADFLIGKQDYRETMRIAAQEQLLSLIDKIAGTPKGADIAVALMDLMVELMDDIPNKDEAVARIRKINGQHAPEDEMSDEEKAQLQQQQQKAQQEADIAKQMQQQLIQMELEQGQSKAMKNTADAMMKKLDGFIKALEAAGHISTNPTLVGAADALVEEAQAAGNGGNKQIP